MIAFAAVNCSVPADEIIRTLSKFRYVDKYHTFREILPGIGRAPESQRVIVNELLNHCCSELLQHFTTNKRPSKQLLRQILIECMDALSVASIDAENREFGYQLGWYLAEKVKVNLQRGTEKKLWGYWKVEGNEVKAPVRPRIAPAVKEKLGKKKRTKKASSEVL